MNKHDEQILSDFARLVTAKCERVAEGLSCALDKWGECPIDALCPAKRQIILRVLQESRKRQEMSREEFTLFLKDIVRKIREYSPGKEQEIVSAYLLKKYKLWQVVEILGYFPPQSIEFAIILWEMDKLMDMSTREFC